MKRKTSKLSYQMDGAQEMFVIGLFASKYIKSKLRMSLNPIKC